MQLREDLGPAKRRSMVLFLGFMLALGGLHMRLVHLQLVNGAYWRSMAENNRVRRLPLPSTRGRIYDRRGQILADNDPTFELLLFPDEARDLHRTALFLARIGVADAATLNSRFAARPQGPLAPLVAGEALTWEQVTAIRAHQSDYPELSVVSGFRRTYPLGPVAAHAIGHLRMVSQAELDRSEGLAPNTLVGATGVEEQQDGFLAGRDGQRLVVASAVGQQLGVVSETPSTAGRDLTVTLDAALQTEVARALGDHAGAVVALDAATGAVRVLYSAPSFDPNVFVGRLSRAEWEALRDDPLHPLQNRCLQGAYPPGSTIKPFLALGALAEGAIDPRWGVTCRGSIILHGHPYRCWRRSGHGRVGLERSLEVSCDVFYYLLGQRLGIHGMAEWLTRFGLGRITGIGFANERAGLVGTPEWSERVRKQPWYPGEAVSVSIGQGPVVATSMQLARGFAALANGGWLVTPHLVQPAEALPREALNLDPDRLALIRAGLRRVVAGGEGTARVLGRLPVAGKTGTAQVISLQEGVDVQDLPYRFRHHAWFVGWAPVDDPSLVLVVLVEHGGGGGSVAAPIAGKIFAAALG